MSHARFNGSRSITSARTALLAGALGVATLAGTAQGQMFQRYNGTEVDEAPYDIEQTLDGGYVTAGWRTGIFDPTGLPDPADFLVVKYDADGVPVWTTQIGGARRDVAYSVHQTADGGYIVAGQTESAGPDFGLALVRLDSTGAVVWESAYIGDVFAELFNPAPDGTPPQVAVRESRATGDIIVTTNRAATAGGQQGVYVRTTGAGVLLTHVTYFIPAAGPLTEMGFSDLKELPDGTIVITGFINRNSGDVAGIPADYDVLAMRITPAGAPIYSLSYGEPSPVAFPNESGYGIDVSADGGRGVIGGGTDRGAAGTIATSHHWIDPLTGALLTNNAFDGMIPAYSATRFDTDLNVVTAGEDYYLPQLTLFGEAAGVSFDPGATFRWLWAYGDPGLTPGFPDRATAVTPLYNPDFPQCGYAFSAFDFEIAFGGIDQHLIKTDDLGKSGCCEEPIETDIATPEMQVWQYGFEPQFSQEQVSWANWDFVGNEDVEKCYSPDCGAPTCPCDLNNDGLLTPDDIALFVTFFTDAIPGNADIDMDGDEDPDDIAAFVACFTASPPLPGC